MKARKMNFRLVLKFIAPILLLLGVAAYQLAFKKTWESYQRYKELGHTATKTDELSVSPGYSVSRAADIAALYKRFQVDTSGWKNQLWNQCAVLAQKYDCSVQGFPEWRTLNYGPVALLKQEVVFAGDFHNLLQLQYALDTVHGLGLTGGLTYSRSQRDSQTTLRLRQLGLQIENN